MTASTDPVRVRLKELAQATGESWRLLSHLIGRNEAYLHHFVHRGSPRRLPEDERRLLAIHFAVDERELGARDPWVPAV